MQAKYVYSGTVRMGTLGQSTGIIDIYGDLLRVGDIVVSFKDDPSPAVPSGLTVVVSDEWTSYSNGVHKQKDEFDFFVMGIKTTTITMLDDDNEKYWHVKRVKKWEDVIDGEHWSDYGFNYKKD